jgi:hypothetical protein
MPENDPSILTSLSKLESLYGSSNHVYYIYSPRWISSSAGIRALHFLCHSINRMGHTAYLVLSEGSSGGLPRINPELQTPILIGVLYFFFQLPLVNTLIFKRFSFLTLYNSDGNINFYGIFVKSLFFGSIFYSIHKTIGFLSNF